MTGREWILAFAEELDVEAPGDADIARLLELAGVAARSSERFAGPLACYLAGSPGVGAGPAVAAARLLSRQGDPPAGEGGEPRRDGGGGGDGTDPDPRFTFANERTFLAWSRTALALVVAGLGIVQLLPPFPGVPAGRHLLGVPLIALGAVLAVVAYGEWVRNQRALRRDEPLPRSAVPTVLAGTVAGMAVIAAVVLLVSALR